MNIFQSVLRDIHDAIRFLINQGDLPSIDDLSAVILEPVRSDEHGDLATNAAMVLTKQAGKKPRELAELIVSELKKLSYIQEIQVAGPGFINLVLVNEIWQKAVSDIISAGKGYGNSDIGSGRRVNLEYVSANPTGPMHIGHARGAVVGDTLAGLLMKCGFDVTKEFYINDAGSQIEVLAKAAFIRYQEALGLEVTPPSTYPGEYLIGTGQGLKEKYQDTLLAKPESELLPLVKEFTVQSMMALIKNDLLALGIEHDVFTSEYQLHQDGLVQKAFDKLKDYGLIYRGILEAPKGKKLEDWEEREQELFKTTEFGDDIDRALKKSDGSWTYFGAELAYVQDKLDRGFKDLIMILGADHSGYIKRTKAAVKALSNDQATMDIKICQLVNFMQGGQAMKMSKRAGSYITALDVVELVGKDAIRFMMLTRKNDALMDFDLDKVKEQSKDNPVFYVQYAHARCQSILRNACEILPAAFADLTAGEQLYLNRLASKEELQLLKLLAAWPRVVEAAAVHHEVHRIAFYLQDLAALFHGLWTKGKDNPGLKFIIHNDQDLTTARLAMVKSVAIVIASGLCVLNIEPANEM